MRNFLKTVLLSTAILGLSCGLALAQEGTTSWSCTYGQMQRIVELNEVLPAAPKCEVWYDKTMEGGTKSRLWAADNDAGYCRIQAQTFVAKLNNMGWTCDVVSDPQR